MARAATFDLAAELAKPSFTPAQRDAPALVELLIASTDAVAARAMAALAKLGDAGRAAVIARMSDANEAGRAQLVGVLGLLARAGDGEARARVLAAMKDVAARVRRAAASALGKLGGDDARMALLARFDAGDAPADEQRVLVEALGKLGGDDVLERLRALTPGDDTELARRRDRALVMVDREAHREALSEVVADVVPPAPVTVVLRCRPGFEALLLEEIVSLKRAAHLIEGGVELTFADTWYELFLSRLWTSAAVRLPKVAIEPEAIARAITSPEVRALLAAWTRGPIRWRLGFASGHKRSIVWQVARDVTAAAPELVNDPTATTWDFVVEDSGEFHVVPRRLADPRFAYRVADVPAASHPTVAAALTWVAGARRDDRVWDPFCGSGVELVERSKRGAYRTLLGTDLDETALEAARANFAVVGLRTPLVIADARTHAAGPFDAIITNPPLGGRIRGDAGALLVEALPNFARQLAPGGRLVWITPAPRKTGPAAERAGLRRIRTFAVDLGGVRGQLEHWERPH